MKTLVISPQRLFPGHGGAPARIIGLTRALRELGHDVHFVYLDAGEEDDYQALENEFGAGKAHRAIRRGRFLRTRGAVRKRVSRLYRRVMRLVRSSRAAHNFLDEWLAPGFADDLRDLQTNHRFQCVIVEYIWISRLLNLFPANVLKIIDTHDVFTDRHVRMQITGQNYSFYSISKDAEIRGLRRADAVFAIAQSEADLFRAWLGDTTPVHMISHIVPIKDMSLRAPAAAAAFLGSPSAGNIDTVRLLVNAVLPRIRAHLPDFRLFIAGRISDAAPDAAGVVKLGAVADLETIYGQAPLLLSPARVGTGIAIKSLEALGMGVPVIATETAARGLPAALGGVRVVADGDMRGFADAVIAVVSDRQVWADMSDGARATARSWNRVQLLELARAIGGG